MKPIMKRNPYWMPHLTTNWGGTNWIERVESTAPAVNLIETEHEYRLELAAPGLKKEDFALKLDEDNNLVVSMEKKSQTKEDQNEKQKLRYLRRDFSYTKFQQKLILSDEVDREKISAKIEEGILTVCIPKMKPENLKSVEKQIEIS